MRRLWPQGEIDATGKVMGEWWPTMRRFHRIDVWQALDELAVAKTFPPALAELAGEAMVQERARRQAGHDLEDEVKSAFVAMKGRYDQDDVETLRDAIEACQVPPARTVEIERRLRLDLGLEPMAFTDDELTARWKRIGQLITSEPEVRKAFAEARMQGLDALSQLELAEAAAP